MQEKVISTVARKEDTTCAGSEHQDRRVRCPAAVRLTHRQHVVAMRPQEVDQAPRLRVLIEEQAQGRSLRR